MHYIVLIFLFFLPVTKKLCKEYYINKHGDLQGALQGYLLSWCSHVNLCWLGWLSCNTEVSRVLVKGHPQSISNTPFPNLGLTSLRVQVKVLMILELSWRAQQSCDDFTHMKQHKYMSDSSFRLSINAYSDCIEIRGMRDWLIQKWHRSDVLPRIDDVIVVDYVRPT